MRLYPALPRCIALGLLFSMNALTQVTTANFYGTVTDSSCRCRALGGGNSGPRWHRRHGSRASATPPANSVSIFSASEPIRSASRRKGFKKFESKNIALVAGQAVRETFALEVGAVNETVSVEGVAPLVSAASSEQSQTFDAQKVTELPLGRRNVSGVLRLSPGIDIGTGRSPRINGLGASGTGISVDGTDANSNPEQRSIVAIRQPELHRCDEHRRRAGGAARARHSAGRVRRRGGRPGQPDLEIGNEHLARLAFRELPVARASTRAIRSSRRTTPTATSIPKPRSVFNQFGGSGGRQDHPR